jgi:type II secretory pathway pseudopilin PulG
MKKKMSAPAYRLPIDFGDEPVFVIPIHKWARSLRRKGRKFDGIIVEPGADQVGRAYPRAGVKPSTLNLKPRFRRGAFTLVEILVVLALLSLIVFALMAVFAATQRAFRASLTQTDTLESGRAVMDLIAGDLEAMTPSGGPNFTSVGVNGFFTGSSPINFSCNLKTYPALTFPPSPLYQPLIGSPSGAQRANLLEDIFILSKGNINGVSSWIATGYLVTTNLPDGTLYPLYRFYMTTNAASGFAGQYGLYTNFIWGQYTNSSQWSHLMNGVVNLTARTYDTNGVWLTNGFYSFTNRTPFIPNATFIGSGLGETSCFFVSNAVPASVSFVLGTLEDHVLRHAEGLSGANQSNYLANAAGQVHIFTRRVWIRNLDPTAYQP